MSLIDMVRSPLKRLRPHRGLYINVDVWAAAHDYHRRQQQLHCLTMHCPGVAAGLEVFANYPPDSSVLVDRGVAVDSDGNVILFPEPERYHLPVEQSGVIYLVLHYDEVEGDAQRVAGEESQPRYAVERGVVELRGQLPTEPYIELARIELSGNQGYITEPENPASPGLDQIDCRRRLVSGPRPLGEIGIGVLGLENDEHGHPRHLSGALEMVQAVNATTRYRAEFKGIFDLHQEVSGCDVLLMAGQTSFSLADDQLRILGHFLDRRGIVWAELCGAGLERINEAAPFLQSTEVMVRALGKNLDFMVRGHPLLKAHHLFAEPPDGPEGSAQILNCDGIIYTNGDYGCLWNGGRPEKAAPRADIRAATELGINLGVYSSRRVHAPLV